MSKINLADSIEDVKREMQAIKEMQDNYVNLMIFLKDIRQSLNEAFNTDDYSYEGLKKTADLIDSQIDSYKYNSFDVGNMTYRTSEVYKRLQQQLSILQQF